MLRLENNSSYLLKGFTAEYPSTPNNTRKIDLIVYQLASVDFETLEGYRTGPEKTVMKTYNLIV